MRTVRVSAEKIFYKTKKRVALVIYVAELTLTAVGQIRFS